MLVAVIATVSPTSPRPALIPDRLMVCGPLFSKTWGSEGMALIVGAALMPVTVTVKVPMKLLMPPFEVPPLSVTMTEIVAEPVVLAVGV